MTSMPLAGSPDPLLSTATETPPSSTGNPVLDQLLLAKILEEKKKEWASWANTAYVTCRNARIPFERQWYLNLAFESGRQYISPIEIPGVGFRLTSPKSPPWRVRLVINKVRGAVRRETAKLTMNKPIPTVVPSTNEDEDYTAAQVGESLIKAAFMYSQFQKEYRSWVWWGTVCGTSYLKQYWDGGAKDWDAMRLPERPMVTDPNSGQQIPVPDDVVSRIPKLKSYLETPLPSKGKIKVERVTPFHLYVPDLLNEDINNQPYVIHVMIKSPEWVRANFGFEPAVDCRASSTIMNSATIIARGSEDHLDSVMVKEVWIKPNGHKDFPEGGLLTIINDRCVQVSEKWPLPFAEYPFYPFNSIPTGGFYGDSPVTSLIPLQKEVNRTRSQAIEIKNTMGRPKLIYPQGSLNPKKISSEPGQSIAYIPGFEKPTVLPGVEVPSSFWNEIDQLSQEFDDISGQHEVSRGGVPNSQVTSGTAISFLSEQDDTMIAYAVASIESAIELLGKHYLYYAGTYWDDDRVIKVTGKDDAFEAIHWKKGVLKGNTDVRIQSGSALPQSKAAKIAIITEWMQNGFISPEVGLEFLEMGNSDRLINEFLVDKKQAQRENLKMAETPAAILKIMLEPAPSPDGQLPFEVADPNDPSGMKKNWMNGDGTPFVPRPPVPVNSWDNHEAHIRWHNQFRKGQEFEALADENKQAFELHVQLHQIALMGGGVNAQGMGVMPNQQGALPAPTDGNPNPAAGPAPAPMVDEGPQAVADTPVDQGTDFNINMG